MWPPAVMQTPRFALCNSHGESLLHYAAAGRRLDAVEYLLGHGLSIHATSRNRWTPLLCALTPTSEKSFSTLVPLVARLLELGASANIVTGEGWTPLHALAAWRDGKEGSGLLTRELIARGAPLDAKASVIHSASANATVLCNAWGFRMKRFVQGPAAEISHEDPAGPLMWAYRTGAMDMFEAILAHWASEAAKKYETGTDA